MSHNFHHNAKNKVNISILNMQVSLKSNVKKSVTFSNTSQLMMYHGTSKAMFYTKEDLVGFRKDVAIAARNASSSNEDSFESIGLETFLEHNLARSVQKRKRVHTTLIVVGQHRLSEGQLRCVSESSSRWAQEKAWKSAARCLSMKD